MIIFLSLSSFVSLISLCLFNDVQVLWWCEWVRKSHSQIRSITIARTYKNSKNPRELRLWIKNYISRKYRKGEAKKITMQIPNNKSSKKITEWLSTENNEWKNLRESLWREGAILYVGQSWTYMNYAQWLKDHVMLLISSVLYGVRNYWDKSSIRKIGVAIYHWVFMV